MPWSASRSLEALLATRTDLDEFLEGWVRAAVAPLRPLRWIAVATPFLDRPEPKDAHASGRALYVYVDAHGRVQGVTLDYEMPHCGLREGLRLALGG